MKDTIIIVDDERLMRQMLEITLGRYFPGFQILPAQDATEALELLGAHPNRVAFMLVDQNMPGMSGLDLIKKIKSEQSNILLILMSGNFIRNYFPADNVLFKNMNDIKALIQNLADKLLQETAPTPP